ncbi:aminotransferase class I/II-fold pyridoxal phosphate-dependent enzyme, partial [Micromonospora echinofusca]
VLRPPPPPDGLDLSTGGPDRRLLPPVAPHLAALAARADTPTGYARAAVLPALADAARERLTADGVPATALTLTAGALDGIERLLTAHLRPGDPVGVEDPGWPNLLDLVAALGLRPMAVPVDDDGPTETGVRAALAAGIRALIVTSRAQNPTGAAVSAARAGALRTLLAGHPHLLLIEDDHAAELAAVPLHPLVGVTPTWAFVRSTSKPFGPDLRLAVLSGDEATVGRVAGRMRLGTGWISTVLQELVLRLWQDRATTDLLDRARTDYDGRRQALLAAFAGYGITGHGRTGINVWVPVPDETRAVTSLRDAGYAVSPGVLHRLDAPPGIRITVSRLDPPGIAPLAAAVARAVGPAIPDTFKM